MNSISSDSKKIKRYRRGVGVIILNKKRKISFINRILYERLNDRQMHVFAKKFSTSDDPLKLLSSAYQWKFKTLLRWINFKNKYEVRTT